MTFVRFIGFIVKWLLISATAVLASLFLLLSSSLGQKTLINFVTQAMAKQGVAITINQKLRFFPFKVLIDAVHVQDEKHAAWLVIKKARIESDLMAVFRSRKILVNLYIEQIALTRLPQTQSASVPADHAAIAWSSGKSNFMLPFSLDLKINLNHIAIAETVVGHAMVWTLKDGFLKWHHQDTVFNIKLPFTSTSMGSTLNVTPVIEGKFDKFNIHLSASSDRFIWHDTTLTQVDFQADFHGLPTTGTGTIASRFYHQNIPGYFQITSLGMNDEKITVAGLHLKGLEADITTDLTYYLKSRALEGVYKAQFKTLLPLTQLLGWPLEGQGTITGAFNVEAAQRTNLSASLHLLNLRNNTFTIKAMTLETKFKDILGLPSGTLNIKLDRPLASDIEMAAMTLMVHLDKGQGNLAFKGTGPDVNVDLATKLILTPERKKTVVQKMSILYQNQPIKLKQPFDIVWQSGDLFISPVTLQVIKFPLEFQGHLINNMVKADLKGRLDLGIISKLFLYSGDIIDGQMQLNLAVNGPVNKPTINGFVRLRDGTYENIVWGTLLRNIKFDLDSDGTQLILKNAAATDGHGGRIQLNGGYHLETQNLSLALNLFKMRVIYTDQIHVVIRDGRFNVQGPLNDLLLQGSITLDKGRYDITKIFLGQIETLNVATPTNVTTHTVPPVPQKPLVNMDMNIKVMIPPVMRVYGRGLDSVWRGSLTLTQSIENPLLLGSLSMDQGNIKFLGKDLRFKHGLITFDGNTENIPTLDMQAFMEQDDFTVTVAISGQATKPNFSLSSTPTLPKDEIMARLLFGRSANKLSPFELLTLAKAVADFRSGGGTGNFFDHITDTLGLDTLSFSAGDKDHGPEVQVGKRFSDKVHIHFDQGIKPEDSKAILEIEPTKNLTITTEIGAAVTSESLGLNYRYNY